MQIITKQNLLSTCNDTLSVVNVFYGENSQYINNWITSFMFNEIVDLGNKYNDTSVTYNIDERNSNYYLVKTEKRIMKGYLYNKYENVSSDVYFIKVVEYDSNADCENSNAVTLALAVEKNTLWNGINNEINHNVLKKSDRDSLYQIILAIESAIKTKNIWNSTELIMLQNQITKDFKKDLYSSVVRKVKNNRRMEHISKKRRLNSYGCTTLEINEQGQLIGSSSGLPDISKWTNNDIEYTIINN